MVSLELRIDVPEVLGRTTVMDCKVCKVLKKEYDHALKFEALSYGRLIAHKRRHDQQGLSTRWVCHMQMVREIARRYTEGDVEASDEVSPERRFLDFNA